jgi:hypothetical protein
MLQIALNEISLFTSTLNPYPTFIIFVQGLPETQKLFQGSIQAKQFERGWSRPACLLHSWEVTEIIKTIL